MSFCRLAVGIPRASHASMTTTRLTLAHSCLALGALFLLACGASHSASDGGTDSAVADGSTSDAGPMDSGTDTGSPDAAVRGTCDAEDARAEICPDFLCDGLSTWHWDGDHCFAIDCGACRGSDCDSAVLSQTECEATHASCDVSLCRDTGGTWAWWLPVCGPYQCGVAPPEDCEVAHLRCDCGSTGRFVDGVGCETDPACPVAVPPPTPEMLCTSTGGSWEFLCCPTVCGVPCAAACAADACNCGPTGIFDEDRGCVVGQRCLEPHVGEACSPDARCQDDTICCDDCGGAGCAGNPTCRVPVCSSDPAIDSCGNNSLAP